MNPRSGSFRSPAGLTLHTVSWTPEGEPRGSVVIVHGYGDHAGRYGRLARALNERGLAVHGLDFPGHGRSAGRRGKVSSFDGLMNDLAAFLRAVGEESPALPVGLFAHSFGGAVAAGLLARRQDAVAALVLSSPYLAHGRPASPATLALVRLLSRVAPGTAIQGVETRAVSRIPGAVEEYRRDPLVFHGRASAGTVVQLFRGFEMVAEAPRLRVPLLVLVGDADRIALPSATVDLFEDAGSADKELEVVPGGYHELLNDEGGDQLIERVAVWLSVRLKLGRKDDR